MKEEKSLLDSLKEKVEKQLKEISEKEISEENVDYTYRLIDIYKDIKEIQNKEEYDMRYRGYGEYSESGYDAENYEARGIPGTGRRRYSESGQFGRRGVKGTGRGRYRGEEMMENMYQAYQDYSEGKEMYGADMNTMKALKYMLKLDKKFIEMLEEEAESPEEKELIAQHKMEMAEM